MTGNRAARKSSTGIGDAIGMIPVQEVVSRMTHENPWFLITASELLMIQEGLQSLEAEIPSTASPHLMKILSTVRTVQDRRP